ncbi:Zf-FLZ domain [Forsythia ovata]|uniref:Zf-FLZ domain n=1 Tax=Forsythia ovata TaxID=205694 RepID=A0ABD1UZS1_9LAMI
MVSKQIRLVQSLDLNSCVDLLMNLVWPTERKHATVSVSHSNTSKPIQIPMIKKVDIAIVKNVSMANTQPAKAAEKPRKSIFTLSSPLRESKEDRIKEQSKNFLYICALCKKKIHWNDNRYMYG